MYNLRVGQLWQVKAERNAPEFAVPIIILSVEKNPHKGDICWWQRINSDDFIEKSYVTAVLNHCDLISDV